jgi:hypothetical protein
MNIFYGAIIIELIIGKIFEAIGMLEKDNLVFDGIIIAISSLIWLIEIRKKYRGKQHEWFRALLVAALAVRIVIAYIDFYTGGIAYFINGDQINFESACESFYETKQALWGGSFSWTVFMMGALYQIVGIQKLLLDFQHIMEVLLSATMIYDIMLDLKIGGKPRIIAMTWMLFEPMLLFHSCVTNREAPIIFFITLSLHFFYKWYKGRGHRYIAGAILFAAIPTLLHGGVLSLVIAYILLYACYIPGRQKFSFNNIKILSLVLAWVVMVFLYSHYGSILFGKLASVDNLEDVTSHATGEIGTAIYTSAGSDADTIIKVVFYTFIRGFYFLFSPTPWDISSLKQVIAFFTSAFIWALSFLVDFRYVAKTSKSDRNRNFFWCLLLMMSLFVAVFAWGTRGANAAIRHREKIIGITVLLYAIASQGLFERRKNRLRLK